MSDDQTNAALARIEAGLGFVGQTIAEVKSDSEKHRIALNRVEQETTRGFGDVKGHIARIEERLGNHITDDDRRFVALQEDVTRAHRKIGGATRYPGESGEASGVVRDDDSKTVKRVGFVGLIGAATGLIYALTEWVKAKLGASG